MALYNLTKGFAKKVESLDRVDAIIENAGIALEYVRKIGDLVDG
jgi:hypothetical protein